MCLAGSLQVFNITPPFPRSWKGKFHILFAHARQLHLTRHILRSKPLEYDVFFVDQLSTCIPFLREFTKNRVVFYCHFPDKLLANGEYVEGKNAKKSTGVLKRIYRLPMDWWEEVTTSALVSFFLRHFNSKLKLLQRTSRYHPCKFPLYSSCIRITVQVHTMFTQSCVSWDQHHRIRVKT
jgi:hypothetical protein